MGWLSRQRATAFTPLSVAETREPLETVVRPVGTVKRTVTESALSSGRSLHGHQVRAPYGSDRLQMSRRPFVRLNPSEPAIGLPWYVSFTSTSSPALYARSRFTTTRSATRECPTGMPADVAASTGMFAARWSSSVVSGPARTVACVRTLPETCDPVGLNATSRSYQRASQACWFGVAVLRNACARRNACTFHAAR